MNKVVITISVLFLLALLGWLAMNNNLGGVFSTATPTITNTATATNTSTPTETPSPTLTMTASLTATFTFTATSPATSTPAPRWTPTKEPKESCQVDCLPPGGGQD